jgi:hypothetical protein
VYVYQAYPWQNSNLKDCQKILSSAVSQLCGADTENFVVATTKWDLIREEDLAKGEAELKSRLGADGVTLNKSSPNQAWSILEPVLKQGVPWKNPQAVKEPNGCGGNVWCCC